MTFETKEKKNDELLTLAVIELLFMGAYIGVSGWYSSLSLMPTGLLVAVWIGRLAMTVCIIVTWLKFKDPNYDKYRWGVVILAAALSLTIGIHHATVKEDKQIIIDSKENASNDKPIDIYIDGKRVDYISTTEDSIMYTFNDSTSLIEMM